jgi:hypothetical protein
VGCPDVRLQGDSKVIDQEKPPEGRFAGIPCPVCGDLYAKSGLPNHIRRHVKLAAVSSSMNGTNRKSLAWWEGWKEGYKVGMHDGRIQHPKKTPPSTKKGGH